MSDFNLNELYGNSGGGGDPINTFKGFFAVENKIVLPDESVWLKTGVVEKDASLYPDSYSYAFAKDTDHYIDYGSQANYQAFIYQGKLWRDNGTLDVFTACDFNFVDTGETITLSEGVSSYLYQPAVVGHFLVCPTNGGYCQVKVFDLRDGSLVGLWYLYNVGTYGNYRKCQSAYFDPIESYLYVKYVYTRNSSGRYVYVVRKHIPDVSNISFLPNEVDSGWESVSTGYNPDSASATDSSAAVGAMVVIDGDCYSNNAYANGLIGPSVRTLIIDSAISESYTRSAAYDHGANTLFYPDNAVSSARIIETAKPCKGYPTTLTDPDHGFPMYMRVK